MDIGGTYRRISYVYHRGRRIADGVEIILELTERNLSPIMQRILQPVVQLIKKVMRAATPEMAEDLLKMV